MGNFKIESRYLMLCFEFRDFIICIKTAFDRPDFQKILRCPLIKRLGRVYVSKFVLFYFYFFNFILFIYIYVIYSRYLQSMRVSI